MVQSQYEELFNESEDLLKQMSYMLESPSPPPSPNVHQVKKRKLKRWVRSGIILFTLFILLLGLAMGGGQLLRIIGRYVPLSSSVEVQSKPQSMSDDTLEHTEDNYSSNMAKVRVSLEIKA